MLKLAPAIRRLTTLALLGCAGATLAAFLGPFFWLCDLFSHFHLQYFCILVGIAITFALIRGWKLLAATALVLIPNLVQVSYYLPSRPTPAVAAPAGVLRVLSFNVLTRNGNHAEVLHYLQESDADIILLLEVSTRWTHELAPLLAAYPHHLPLPRGDNFGLALYSRFPILEEDTTNLPPGVPAIIASIDSPAGPLTVIGAHPIPPMGDAHTRSRDQYLAHVATRARDAGTSTILMGDLNTTPWSYAFRRAIADSGLRDSGKHRGFQSTWNRFHPLKSIPIDHVLHTPDLQVIDRHIGPNLGSDHHPVHVTFGVNGNGDVPPTSQGR